MRAMILAAGLGTRMGALARETPKPLLPVGGRPLIEHQILRLREGGFRDFVVNVARLGDRIREALGDGRRWAVRIRYSDEGGCPVGTGEGVRRALALLGEAPFALVSADVWTDYPYARLHRPPPGDAHLVLVSNPPHHRRGDFVLEGERVRFPPPARCRPGGWRGTFTYSGLAVCTPALFRAAPRGTESLVDVLSPAVASGRVTGELWDGAWLDVGTPERLEAAREQAARSRPGPRQSPPG